MGRRNTEYLSLGVDTVALLRGRTPIQVYHDFMRSFKDEFSDFLGEIITVSIGSVLFNCFKDWFWNYLGEMVLGLLGRNCHLEYCYLLTRVKGFVPSWGRYEDGCAVLSQLATLLVLVR